MYDTETLSKIQKICRILPDYRKQNHLEFLFSCAKSIKLFRDMSQKHGESSLLSCCQHLHYEFIPSGEYIFRYGDIGTKFYIVLSGSVVIYIPSADSGRIVYKEIMTFTSGTSFGELALESSKPRSASAACKTDTHFLVLLQKDYQKFMQRLVIEKKNDMINFLHSLPAFSKLNKLAISKLTYNIKEVAFTKGQVIFNEGDLAKEIYIIREGECKLTKIIQKPSTSAGVRRLILKRVYTAKRIGKGSMIAEDDIMSKLPHSYSCLCTSDTVFLYVIPAEDFFSRITNDQPLKFMKRISKDKKSFLDGWSSCRSSLDLIFAKSTEIKQKVRRKELSEVDNIQKLKKALVERMKENRNIELESLPMTPLIIAKSHKKIYSSGNLFLLTSPKIFND